MRMVAASARARRVERRTGARPDRSLKASGVRQLGLLQETVAERSLRPVSRIFHVLAGTRSVGVEGCATVTAGLSVRSGALSLRCGTRRPWGQPVVTGPCDSGGESLCPPGVGRMPLWEHFAAVSRQDCIRHACDDKAAELLRRTMTELGRGHAGLEPGRAHRCRRRRLADRRVRVIHTPGHPLGHIALLHEPTRTVMPSRHSWTSNADRDLAQLVLGGHYTTLRLGKVAGTKRVV
ncbi:hypothetical protein [Streptomyces sp. NPDC048192]|uniref:hypothetical protein n=1 Tax=Streptomyces sp. NPDC048192 TaxID=3365510 RepID=UPI00371A18C9